MNKDIIHLLTEWPFDPENSIRKIIDEDGTERIQVRVDQGAFQGILQMELDGRPDGRRPHETDFVLEYYREKLDLLINDSGSEEGFCLGEDDCKELFDESRRMYERYVFLLQIQDYDRVIRDTEFNMALFRFVNRYADNDENKNNLEKWWPYVVRIHAVARVMISMQSEDFESAFKIIDEARERIEGLGEVDTEEFHIERRRSFQALEDLKKELNEKRPETLLDKLNKELDQAIEREEFERAAKLRDRLKELEEHS